MRFGDFWIIVALRIADGRDFMAFFDSYTHNDVVSGLLLHAYVSSATRSSKRI